MPSNAFVLPWGVDLHVVEVELVTFPVFVN